MSKRSRHTAPFLLSHFLCSNDQFKYEGLNGNYQAILRYMYDVMEMNFHQTGQLVCIKSYAQIGKFSGTSEKTVERALAYFIKNNLLSIVSKKFKKKGHYGIGSVIESGVTMTPVDKIWRHHDGSTGVTMTPYIITSKGEAAPQDGRGSQKAELSFEERLERFNRITRPH